MKHLFLASLLLFSVQLSALSDQSFISRGERREDRREVHRPEVNQYHRQAGYGGAYYHPNAYRSAAAIRGYNEGAAAAGGYYDDDSGNVIIQPQDPNAPYYYNPNSPYAQ